MLEGRREEGRASFGGRRCRAPSSRGVVQRYLFLLAFPGLLLVNGK